MSFWHATLNTFGGKFFFQLVDGTDEARLAVLMTAGYVIAALAVFFMTRSRLDQPKKISTLTKEESYV